MPTIAEPPYWELKERREAAINDFVNASPDTVDDSDAVLRARLFGYRLRGQDLDHAVRRAQEQQLAQRRSHTVRIHRVGDRFQKRWAQGNLNALTWTLNQSAAGKYTLQECAALREQLLTTAPDAVVTIDGT